MTGKQILRLLKGHGWKVDRINGSHHILFKGEKIVVIPVHGNRELPKGTLNSILKQADLK